MPPGHSFLRFQQPRRFSEMTASPDPRSTLLRDQSSPVIHGSKVQRPGSRSRSLHHPVKLPDCHFQRIPVLQTHRQYPILPDWIEQRTEHKYIAGIRRRQPLPYLVALAISPVRSHFLFRSLLRIGHGESGCPLPAGRSSTLSTLTGLAAHTTLTLSFDLALWDSVDLGSDVLTLKADGVDLISALIPTGNYFPADNLGVGPGTLLTPAFTAFAIPNFGSNADFRDSARRISSITFSHTASSAVFSFGYPASQRGQDESFGIDNIVVESNAAAADPAGIPEPSTFVLAAGALATLITLRRKK